MGHAIREGDTWCHLNGCLRAAIADPHSLVGVVAGEPILSVVSTGQQQTQPIRTRGTMARRREKQEKGRTRKRGPAGSGQCEWVGGRVVAPFFVENGVEEGGDPFRPEMVLWVEAPSGLVVGQQVSAPEEAAGALGRALLEAMRAPLIGPARRPDTIRVADAEDAAALRAAVGDAVPVTIAPTPELDALLSHMLDSMDADAPDPSFLDDGRIAPEAVAELFASAEVLYRMAPWKVASDEQVLRLDIPSLDVEGVCLSIIGSLDENLGLILFPSIEGYDAFLRAGEKFASGERDTPVDLGTDWLSLSFDRGADLPASMRHEVAKHAWPVAGAGAYPVVMRFERDGITRPPTERELEIVTACTTSLCAFFLKHRSLFEMEEFEPVCESYFNENDREVCFTVPYGAYAQFDDEDALVPAHVAPAVREVSKPGRNAACPCGSGRKYKKCCLAKDQEAGTEQRDRQAGHDLDSRLTHELIEFAFVRYGMAWRRFTQDFSDVEETLQLAIPWSVYHYRTEGQSVLEAYLEASPRRLSRAERGWLDAQKAAWLSLWEVSDVERGVSISLRDMLTGETRCVNEVSGSEVLVARDVLLGRVADYEGAFLLCGSHPRPLPPGPAAEVLRRARGRLRRKRAVPIDRLRDESFGRYLIKRWEEAVDALDVAYADQQAGSPEIQNTDGDPLLLTIDHFEIAPGKRRDVEGRLAELADVDSPEVGESDRVYVFLRSGNALHKSWENTVVGHGRFFRTSLQLETNSKSRADVLRARVEGACGGLISHRAREHADPVSEKASSFQSGRDIANEPSGPEAEQLVLGFKRRHYADWPDHPLPALDGQTPREAAQTARGRGDVDVLLKEMENREQRMGEGASFDFSGLRSELGLE